MEQDRNNSQESEVIGKLIAAAGPGATASPEARDRVFDAVRARWEDAVREREHARLRNRVRRYRVFGLAASAAAIAVTVYLLQSPSTDTNVPDRLATVSHAIGDAAIQRNGATPGIDSVEPDAGLAAGDALRTGADGLVALLLNDDLILRVNVNSELVFTAADRLDLISGTVYLDSGTSDSSAALRLATPLGTVEHLGTQYEVNVGDGSLRIRVREGAVAYTGSNGRVVSETGQQLDVADDGQTDFSAVATNDAVWDWAAGLASLAQADRYLIGDVAPWIARELGLRVEYNGPASLGDEEIKGLFGGLSISETLFFIERTAQASITISGDRLIVGN